MVTVWYEGKPLSMPLDVVKAGEAAIKSVVAASGFPMVENAQITIDWPKEEGAPPRVHVAPRATKKGSGQTVEPFDEFVAEILNAPEYINPAIALAAQVMQEEAQGNPDFLERAEQAGDVERAVMESLNYNRDLENMLIKMGTSVPVASKIVPVGF
jgi:hypothetical protein